MTVATHQWERAVVSSRQRSLKPQRNDTGRGRSKQPPNHPQCKPSPVKSAAGSAHQESRLYSHRWACKWSPSTFSSPHQWGMSYQCQCQFHWWLVEHSLTPCRKPNLCCAWQWRFGWGGGGVHKVENIWQKFEHLTEIWKCRSMDLHQNKHLQRLVWALQIQTSYFKWL